jgi:hypothetical protein
MGFNIGRGVLGVVGIVIAVIIFAAMLPMVTETIDDQAATGTTGLLLDNIPLFLVLGLVLTAIGAAVMYIKGAE